MATCSFVSWPLPPVRKRASIAQTHTSPHSTISNWVTTSITQSSCRSNAVINSWKSFGCRYPTLSGIIKPRSGLDDASALMRACPEPATKRLRICFGPTHRSDFECSQTRLGCIALRELAKSLRRALGKISVQIERRLRRSDESAAAPRPTRRISGPSRCSGFIDRSWPRVSQRGPRGCTHGVLRDRASLLRFSAEG